MRGVPFAGQAVVGDRDPLDARILEPIAIGVTTRKYRRMLGRVSS